MTKLFTYKDNSRISKSLRKT